MLHSSRLLAPLVILFLFAACTLTSETADQPDSYLQISGIYPHLTAYNQPADSSAWRAHRECGIGAVVPWAGHLWYLTYPPHMRTGSNDKLYRVDENLHLTVMPESRGGTHANRLIHRESQQLLMGAYLIDAEGKVRTFDQQQLEGRLTATTRHLTQPDSLVYYVDMEGMIYEANVYSLAVRRLFEKPVPGWHGKGAYLGQNRLIVANNGEHAGHSMGYDHLEVGGPPENEEDAGVLAEWDGTTWRIEERRPFTDVTGPGGLYGNASPQDPVWSMGWDRRSVLLKVLDETGWHRYRLPKASHSFDPLHGWYTEWPRIREVGNGQRLMVMHGTLFDFPGDFSSQQSGGIQPIATHLRYIPDFCDWNGRLILAADDASRMQNPIVGQPQSNLWFGQTADLPSFGPALGWGGVWLQDQLAAGQSSDPLLIAGYQQRVLHLHHQGSQNVNFRLELDLAGTGEWTPLGTILLPPHQYWYELLPEDLNATWLRITPDQPTTATAYLHQYRPRSGSSTEAQLFAGLARPGEAATQGLIRPASHNRSLQLVRGTDEYWEVDLSESAADLAFSQPGISRAREVNQLAALSEAFVSQDAASVIITDEVGQRWRVPFSSDPALRWTEPIRNLREIQSERFLANIGGMFYEVPRSSGTGNHRPDFEKMKPVARHDRAIMDYASWRGLLVLTGVKDSAAEDGQVFRDAAGGPALWFGNIDDLWKFGAPTGVGGPWKQTQVQAGQPSDPYLMTGFERKGLSLSHNAARPIDLKVEVRFYHGDEWYEYDQLTVPPGEGLLHEFPAGYQAHWVRLTSNRSAELSATFIYSASHP